MIPDFLYVALIVLCDHRVRGYRAAHNNYACISIARTSRLFLRPAQSPGPGTGQNRRRGTWYVYACIIRILLYCTSLV